MATSPARHRLTPGIASLAVSFPASLRLPAYSHSLCVGPAPRVAPFSYGVIAPAARSFFYFGFAALAVFFLPLLAARKSPINPRPRFSSSSDCV
jgi:hypothetical protein